ncbi:SulP family inorganic anion transporter [Synechococcus sp. J7-Johnson]|uniref:SulP family inorganic anion transporter n=1 Tax=Synechococcus sp. J7-Johnson TaxID=2823737 RepID=UPI0020CED869|nr:SulP family inorganic anion transporter [Synechococcus sp. J7-Johnson]MCP9839251.1 SulP family inorganic anion transporter [Synechococcus sp. J7-Johnson]
MSRYRQGLGQADLAAGLTAAAVVLPKAMAYATIAGLPVQVGLYTALVPMAVYALLGSSRPLSVSTTTTLAILVGSELNRLTPTGEPGALVAASATLALLVGAMLCGAALLRLGFIANFISESVLVGFKSGIGVVIVADQLPKLLGLHAEKDGFFRDLAVLLGQIPQASLATILLSAGLFSLLFSLRRRWPSVPAPLVVVAIAIASSALLGLDRLGVELVGAVPRGLPALTWPRLDLLGGLWPGAAGIAMMSFTESIAAARAFRASDEPSPDPDRELLALGLANIGGGFFGAMAAGGGTTQTAVNRQAGARSQVAELVTAGAALATLLLLAPWIALMPQAALAVVVIVYSFELIAPGEFLAIRRVRHIEFRWAVVAFLGVVFLGTLKGILVAVILSLLALVQQEVNPPVYAIGRKRGTDVFRPLSARHPHDETWPGLLLLRAEGRLFFANAHGVLTRMRAEVDRHQPRVVVLDGSAVIDLEYSALKVLTEAERQLDREGISLWLAGLNPTVLEVIRRSELGERLGKERMHRNIERAVEHYLAEGLEAKG